MPPDAFCAFSGCSCADSCSGLAAPSPVLERLPAGPMALRPKAFEKATSGLARERRGELETALGCQALQVPQRCPSQAGATPGLGPAAVSRTLDS